MKPILLCVLAIFFYACGSVLLARKLSTFTPFVYMLGFYALMLPITAISLLSMRRLGGRIISPSGREWMYVAALAVIYFVADTAIFSAYHAKGSAVVMATIASVMPVMVGLITACTGGALPTRRQVLGVALGILAVYCVSSGERKESSPAPKYIPQDEHTRLAAKIPS